MNTTPTGETIRSIHITTIGEFKGSSLDTESLEFLYITTWVSEIFYVLFDVFWFCSFWWLLVGIERWTWKGDWEFGAWMVDSLYTFLHQSFYSTLPHIDGLPDAKPLLFGWLLLALEVNISLLLALLTCHHACCYWTLFALT